MPTLDGGLAPGEISLMCAAFVGRFSECRKVATEFAGLREQVRRLCTAAPAACGLGKEIPRRNDHDKFPPTYWFIRQWSGGIMPL